MRWTNEYGHLLHSVLTDWAKKCYVFAIPIVFADLC